MSTFEERERMLIDKLSATDPLAQVAQVAKHLPQQEATKILRYATAFGDAPDVVAQNLKAYDMDGISSVDWENTLKDAPRTKVFLSNPLPLAVVQNKENAIVLAGIEKENKVLSAINDGLKESVRFVLRGAQGVFEATAAGAANEQKISEMPPEYQQWSQQGGADMLKKLGEATNSLADSKVLQSKNLRADTVAGQYGLDLVRKIPQLITQMGAAALTGPIGAGALMGTQIAGADYEKYRQGEIDPATGKVKEGSVVDPARAMGAAIGDAALQAPLETIGLGKIMKTVQKGVPVKERVMRYLEAGLTEGVTEWLQQYPQGAADIYATNPKATPQEMTQKFIKDFWANTKEGLYQGAVAFPLGVFGGAVHNAMQRQATQAFVQNIEAIQARLTGSAILNQSPELVEQHLEVVTGGEKVYIDPDALVLYQMENPKALEELGLTEKELDDLLGTGEMAEVSKARYMTATSLDPGLHEALKDDIAPTTDGLTQRRIGERKNQKDVQRATDKLAEEEQGLKQWRQEYSQTLKDAGMDADVAKQVLVGLASHAKAMSDNPVEWLRQNAPKIRSGEDFTGAVAYGQFAGVEAKTADHLQLNEAKSLLAKGIAPEEVRKQTGWFKGMDGRLRFEIDDSKARLIDQTQHKAIEKEAIALYRKANKQKDATKKAELMAKGDELFAQFEKATQPRLGNVLEHEALFKAYPSLADMKVVFDKRKEGDYGAYDPAVNAIYINDSLSPEKVKETILHEIQHAIQEQEDFARGGSPKQFQRKGAASAEANDKYQRLAGEVEARDTASRANLTEEQRKEKAPDLRSDAIIMHGGREYAYNQSDSSEQVLLQQAMDAVSQIADGAEEVSISNLRPDLKQYGGSADVSFIWGDKKKGLQHIGNKRGANTVLKVVEAVALGKLSRYSDIKKTVVLEHDGYEAVLSLDEHGKTKTWLLTGWHKNKPDASGEVSTQSAATQARPTFSRSDLGAGLSNFSISKSSELFQSEKNPKGAIQWDEEGRAVITLFENADESTVIHEMVGHFFFQNLINRAKMDDAPNQVKADAKTLLEWAGVEGDFDAFTKEQKKEVHEKVARAAEVYIMTGKAPSIATQSLFRRFAEWMKQVYKSIKELGVEVTPEVSAVFDRMLATEAEIAEMEAVEQYRKALPAEFLNQLTDQQRARLDKQLANVRAEAEERLRGRVMAWISADNKKLMEEERASATEQITQQVKAEPVYVVAAEIETTFKANPKTIAQRYKNNKLPQDQEAEIDYLAELHGFSSGDEVATRILNALSVNKEIDARVNEHMETTFPDLLKNKEAIQEEARHAMYNDDGALLLAIEQQLIEEKTGKFFSAEQAREHAIATRKAAKATAQSIMAKRTIAEATNLKSYIAAERRSAVDADKYLRKADMEQAKLAKERQQLNHALIQECLRIRRETERIKKYLNRQRKAKNWMSDTVDENGLRVKTSEYKEQAAAILARFGFTRKDFVQPEEPLAEWMRRQESDEVNGAIINIAPWLAYDNTRRDIRKLTIEELQDVENAIKNIKTMATIGVNSDGFAFINSEGKEATVERLLKQSSQLTDKQVDHIEKEKVTASQEMRAGLKQCHRLLEMLDAFKSFGPWYDTFYNSVKRAADLRSRLLDRVYTRMENAFKSEGISKAERYRMAHKKIYIEEWNESVTKNTLLAIALNMGNQGNIDRLTATRLVGVSMKTPWTQESIKAVLEKYLTASDFRLVGKIWKAIDVYQEYNEMVQRMTGNELPKVEPIPITFNAAGEEIYLEGGYYPLSQDSRGSKQAELNAEKKLGDAPGMMPYPSTGRSKARSKGAQYAVDTDFANLYGNMTEIIQDITFRPVAHDMNKLLRDERVIETIRTKLGEAEYNTILEWQKRVTTGRSEVVKHTLDKVLNWARGATVISSLLLRPGVAVQNVANFALYGNSVEGWSNRDAFAAYVKHGWSDYIPNALANTDRAKELRRFVYERSAQMRDKMENPDFSFRELHGIGQTDNWMLKQKIDLFSLKTIRFDNAIVQEAGVKAAAAQQNVIDFASDVFAWTDQLTDIPMWIGAYEKAKESGKTEADAVNFADAVVRNSTGTGRNIDTSRLQASGSAAERLLTMFQTFLNTAYNRWAAEYNVFLQKKDTARLIKFVAVQYLMFGTLSALSSFKTPDDDDDWAKWFIKEVLDWPLGMIPLFGGIAKVAMDKAMGFQTYAYKVSPVFGKIDDTLKMLDTAQKVAEGQKGAGDLAEPTANVASFFMRYPDQLNDWFFNAYDVLSGNMEPEWRDLVKRRPSREKQ